MDTDWSSGPGAVAIGLLPEGERLPVIDEAGSDPASDKDSYYPESPIQSPVHEPATTATASKTEQQQAEMTAQAGSEPSIPPAGAASTDTLRAAMRPPPPSAAVAESVQDAEMPNRSEAIVLPREELQLAESTRPEKQARLAAISEQHEDGELEFHFTNAELDTLEDYEYIDLSMYEPEYDDKSHVSSPSLLPDQLIFPYTPHEPCLPPEELQALDAIADAVEIERLQSMNVLKPKSENVDGVPKRLSTKFVRTWRDKWFSGEHKWLRRSRLVAREFAWADVRDDLLSPASNSLGTRILPSVFMRNRKQGWILGAVDVSDAFLTVDQVDYAEIKLTDSMGETREFCLGKVLPGQRNGCLMWYDDITKFLCTQLGMIQLDAYPNLLKSPDGECLIMLHVDDMMVCGNAAFVDNKLLPALQARYKISSHFIREVGDDITFLKKSHRLLSEDSLVISAHPRHLEQLMKLAGLKPSSRPKRVPAHPLIDEVDDTELLDPAEASELRSGIGILLCLAPDYPHCQYCKRFLRTGMSRPTERMKNVFRHLVSYLHGAKEICLALVYAGDSVGLHHVYDDDGMIHLEAFSDADWVANREHRKSIS